MEKELWELLNNANIKEIKTMVCMSIEYLVQVYGLKYKDIIKDIKKARKYALKKRGAK